MSKPLGMKIMYSAVGAVFFILFSHPLAYQLTSKLTGDLTFDSLTKCPTVGGHFIHTLVFLTVYLIFKVLANLTQSSEDRNTFGQLFKYSFYSTLLFFIVSSPELYQLTGNVTGGALSSPDGCPTGWGVATHTIVYFIVLFLVMFLPRDKCF